MLASASSDLLKLSTPNTLGPPAMSCTQQASCTCRSLYIPPEFTWSVLSHPSGFCSNITSSKSPSQAPCVNELYPLQRRELEIKNQGPGCHKTEKQVSTQHRDGQCFEWARLHCERQRPLRNSPRFKTPKGPIFTFSFPVNAPTRPPYLVQFSRL